MYRTIISLVGLFLFSVLAFADDQIRIVGSSTVYPFATAVAERFGKSGHLTPIIESTGTGGGFKIFCTDPTVDINNASRKIKESETKMCLDNGFLVVKEYNFGRDAIVVAHAKNGNRFDATKDLLWLALAKTLPINGELVPNPYRLWSDIDSKLPAVKIEVLGPPPTSGTRDSFIDQVMLPGCEAVPFGDKLKSLTADEKKKICSEIRTDGAYVEAGENDNLIVQKLEANPNSYGIFGFSFLEANMSKLIGLSIMGVEPTEDTVYGGTYPLVRNLYFYVKQSSIDSKPDVGDFIKEFMSPGTIGEDGYLVDKGLVPLQ